MVPSSLLCSSNCRHGYIRLHRLQTLLPCISVFFCVNPYSSCGFCIRLDAVGLASGIIRQVTCMSVGMVGTIAKYT